MATRHQARNAVVGLLYAYDLGNETIADFFDEMLEEQKILEVLETEGFLKRTLFRHYRKS